MFKSLVVSLALLSATPALAAEKIAFEVGKYFGKDPSGRVCSLHVVAPFGYDKMDSFRFENVSHYNVHTGFDPQTETPGTYARTALLMADGWVSGKRYFRSITGAPIFGEMVEVSYEIRYANGKPFAARLARRPMPRGTAEALPQWEVLEQCTGLRK